MKINLLASTPPPKCTKGKSFFYKALLAVAIISVLFNVLAILPYVHPYYTKFQRKYFPKEHFSNQTPDKEVLDRVCKATIKLKGMKMSMDEPKGLPEDILSLFRTKRGSSTTNSFFTSYAMVGISYYAMAQADSSTMDQLRKKTDVFIDVHKHSLCYPVTKIDQAPIGILLLNLYQWYKDELYIKTAQNLYAKIKNMKDEQGRILYTGKGAKMDYVDALGMYVPFFMEYFKVTNDSTALTIVRDNMLRYQRYAINPKTGLPTHGYNLINGLPVGSVNWGRGIGWYLLAAAFYPQMHDSNLDQSLSCLDYTQFPGSDELFDSSTAIMIEIYKQSKDKNRKLSLRFIKSHILTDGYVDDCSGDTYGLNSYSHTFGESELCNGLLLMLASKFDNSQSENEKL